MLTFKIFSAGAAALKFLVLGPSLRSKIPVFKHPSQGLIKDKPNKKYTEHGEDILVANRETKEQEKNIISPILSRDYASKSRLCVNTSICLASQSSQGSRHLKICLKEFSSSVSLMLSLMKCRLNRREWRMEIMEKGSWIVSTYPENKSSEP